MTRKRANTAARYLVKSSLFIALVITALALYFYSLLRPVNSGAPATSQFEVIRGHSTLTIANNLESAGYIRSPFMFRVVVKLSDLGGKLQAGFFQLSPAMNTLEIARALTKGMIKSNKLTIPEGFRLEQIAQAASLPVPEFLAAGKGMEGQLFPDTYYTEVGITSAQLVELMHNNFVAKVGEIDKRTLILASLIERETKGNTEKPVVAGIMEKRLAAGWPLELDATVQYFLGNSDNWWPNTTLLDRGLASPYNTYLHTGLPPGPIGNPGLESINAARAPKASPYWFYLHDSSGLIHYGATIEEHNANVRTYIQ